ncbi:MAG: cupredoxin domain-containing protein, partial [Dehalococcoidia bacterium]
MSLARPLPLRSLGAGALILALACVALASWSVANAATVEGSVEAFQFKSPATVAPGDTINWANKDQAPHTITSKTAGLFDVSVAAGASGSMTAPAAGTYDLICKVHPNMAGKLVVAAPATGGTSPAAPRSGTGLADGAG